MNHEIIHDMYIKFQKVSVFYVKYCNLLLSLKLNLQEILEKATAYLPFV